MDMALNDYIHSKNIDMSGKVEQRSNQQNGQSVMQRKRQRNFKNGNSTTQFNRNGFKNRNRSFDLRSKCGRQGQQPQQQQRWNHVNPKRLNNGRKYSNPNIGCNGGHGNHSRTCNLNHVNQCQHQTTINNPHAMHCANAFNACHTATIQNQHQHQHQQHGQLMPISCAMLQHQHHPIHSTNSIVPVGVHHNHHAYGHALGCQAQSACINSAGDNAVHHNHHAFGHALGCQAQNACTNSGGDSGGIAGNSFNNSSTIINALGKLLSSNNTPLRLTVQVQSPRIADEVEEMEQSN